MVCCANFTTIYLHSVLPLTRALATMNITKSNESLALTASCILLCIAVFTYPQLFLFSKTIQVPAWAQSLPYKIYAGAYLGLIAFLPITIFSKTKPKLIGFYFITSAVAIFPAGISRHIGYGDNLLGIIFNSLFHYAYSIFFVLSWPMLVTFLARFLKDIIQRASKC